MLLGAAWVALSAQGCDCGARNQLGRVFPKIEVTPAAIDFGEVPFGATKHARITVRNAGSANLMIGALDVADPFKASLPAVLAAPGTSVLLDVSFSPPPRESLPGDPGLSGTLRVPSNDPNQPVSMVSLTGKAIQGLISVRPSRIAFMNTSVGSTRRAEIIVANSGLADIDGRISTDGFPRPEHFRLSAVSAFGSTAPFALPARSEVPVDLEYRPFALGADDGRILFETCGDRCGVEVEVAASAAEAVVRLDPPLVDFGAVGIQSTATRPVRVDNVGTRPFSVVSVMTAGGAELSASPARGLPAVVEPNSSLGINVEFRPTSAAALAGELIVQTDDPVLPEASVRVVGRGEGPLFVVQPSELSFGVQRRTATYRHALLLLNAGSADVRVTSIETSGTPFGLASGPGLPVRLGSGESLLVNATFTPPGAGAYRGQIIIGTDDPNNPIVRVPLSGGMADRICEISQSVPRLNFGRLPIGFARNRSVTLTNSGTDPCRLLSGEFRAPVDPAIAIVGSPWPLELLPGQQSILTFRYSPTMTVESKGNFVMMADDPVFPERHLALLGTALDYDDVFTQPQMIDFGTVSPNCSAGNRALTIFNAGRREAVVESVSINPPIPEFSLTQVARTPFAVPSGGSAGFFVSYTARDVGVKEADVEIKVRDHLYALVVPLKGEGTSNPRVTDRFQQRAEPKIDVLIVIGNTQMFADLQPGFHMNTRAFIEQTNLRQVDFRMGVVSTSLYPVAGRLVGPVMDRSTPNLESVFNRQTDIGALGNDDEQGLEAMASAFRLADRGVVPNRNLFRIDAFKVVIIITDDDDRSAESLVYYFNQLRNHAPRGYLFIGVTGQATGCGDLDRGTAAGGAEPSPRYERFVMMTQGISESECGPWGSTLARIGAATFGTNRTFILTKAADLRQPIVVKVNGVEVPSSGWMYDSARTAITFVTAPAPDAVILVEYTPNC